MNVIPKDGYYFFSLNSFFTCECSPKNIMVSWFALLYLCCRRGGENEMISALADRTVREPRVVVQTNIKSY